MSHLSKLRIHSLTNSPLMVFRKRFQSWNSKLECAIVAGLIARFAHTFVFFYEEKTTVCNIGLVALNYPTSLINIIPFNISMKIIMAERT